MLEDEKYRNNQQPLRKNVPWIYAIIIKRIVSSWTKMQKPVMTGWLVI